MLHWHHVIPRHAGGTDDPSNLIQLTIEDHAIAHKVLYRLWGRWQDRVAWLTLSGKIGKEEAERLAFKESQPQRIASILKALKEGRLKRPSNKGMVRSNEWRQKVSSSMQGNTNGAIKHKVVECPHCHKVGGNNLIHRYHFTNCKKRVA